MQSSRARLTCRAHNRFTPSIALWQHFIAPTQQHRLSSTAAEALREDAETTSHPVTPSEASSAVETKAEAGLATPRKDKRQQVQPKPIVRRVATSTGEWHDFKQTASVAKSQQVLWHSRQASLKAPEKLLAVARAAFEASEDYEGVIVEPMVNSNAVKESDLPWCLSREERASMPPMDRLVEEMNRFSVYARPNRYDKLARSKVIEQVRDHVRSRFPKHTLEVFGSERTGIALATSDIDLRLLRPGQVEDPAQAKLPPAPEKRAKALRNLQMIHSRLKELNKSYMLTMVRYARYPLISLQDRNSGLDLQIVLANDTSESRRIMHRYMEEYPHLQTLFTVVKTMFDIRGLSDVFRGGFGSYSLFMMMVASIQQSPHPRNDAAGALLNFLRFWRDFDTTKHGISIEPAELFEKDSVVVMTPRAKAKIEAGTAKPLPPYMLCLRDPADPTNNLGRKGIAIKHVQTTFKSLLRRLEHDLQMKTRPTYLGPLVGPVYMLNKARREKLEARGKRLMLQSQASLADLSKAVREGTLAIEQMPAVDSILGNEKTDGRKAAGEGEGVGDEEVRVEGSISEKAGGEAEVIDTAKVSTAERNTAEQRVDEKKDHVP